MNGVCGGWGVGGGSFGGWLICTFVNLGVFGVWLICNFVNLLVFASSRPRKGRCGGHSGHQGGAGGHQAEGVSAQVSAWEVCLLRGPCGDGYHYLVGWVQERLKENVCKRFCMAVW